MLSKSWSELDETHLTDIFVGTIQILKVIFSQLLKM